MNCPKCKSWNPGKCKDVQCPVMAKFSSQKKILSNAKQDFFGKSPSVFVGRFGYPDVNVGFLSLEEYNQNDEPKLWSKENYSIDKVIGLRSSLINSSFKNNVKSFNDRLISMGQEVALSSKPVDVEINLTKKPSFALSMGPDVLPHGPNIKLKKARITENAKIPQAVDKIISDNTLKAGSALNILYKKEFDEHYLTKLLSTGTLGSKMQRKLVPTRWSITAVDDTLGKNLITKIKDYPVHDYSVFFGGHLGNYFVAITLPEIWSYELFETSTSQDLNNFTRASYTYDFEFYEGRKEYVSETAGGYYAARLSVLEYLISKKRQATVILLRFITDEYYAPLGVWVVREAVRKTMASQPLTFDSKELTLSYVKALVKRKFGMNSDLLLNNSMLLKNQKVQTKLNLF